MLDFVKDIEKFHKDPRYPNIHYVYLVILWADIKKTHCSRKYLEKSLPIQSGVLAIYLKKLCDDKYIYLREDGCYTTGTRVTEVPNRMSVIENIVDEALVSADKKPEIRQLIQAIVKDSANKKEELAWARKFFGSTFGNYLNLREEENLHDFIDIITKRKSFTNWTPMDALADIKYLQYQRHQECRAREQLALSRRVDETPKHANRIARHMIQYLKRSPERLIGSHIIPRKEFKRLYDNRVNQFPAEMAPEELVIQELAKLGYKVGGQHGT